MQDIFFCLTAQNRGWKGSLNPYLVILVVTLLVTIFSNSAISAIPLTATSDSANIRAAGLTSGSAEDITEGITNFNKSSRDTIQLDDVINTQRLQDVDAPFVDTWSPEGSEGLHLGLDRMLLSLPGVTGVRSGGIGSYMAFSLWGSSADQVNIFVDGIQQNKASDGLSRIGDLDPSRIKQIEIHKAASALNEPGSPMGGSIYITTRDGLQGAVTRGSLGFGSFGEHKAEGEVNAGLSHASIFARLAYQEANNNYFYQDDLRSEYVTNEGGIRSKNETDLTERNLEHNGHHLEEVQLMAKLYPGEDQVVKLNLELSRLKKDFPVLQIKIPADSGAYREVQSGTAYLDYSKSGGLGSSESNTQVKLIMRGSSEDYNDLSGVLGTGLNLDRNTYALAAFNLFHTRPLNTHFTASALGSYTLETHQYENRITGETNPQLFRYAGEFKPTVDMQWNEIGRWRLQSTFRYTLEEYYTGNRYIGLGVPLDKSRDDFALDGLVSWTKAISSQAQLETQASTGHRDPSFYERFGDRGVVKGNPALEPERSVTYSAGFAYKSDSSETFSLQGRVFHRSTNNAITMSGNSQNVIVFQNSDQTLALGEELAAQARFFQSSSFPYRIQAAFTHTSSYAINTPPGEAFRQYQQLPFIPLWTLALNQNLQYSIFELKHLIYLRGLSFTNPSGSSTIYDPYADNRTNQWKHDVILSAHLGNQKQHGLKLSLGINNVTDERLLDFYNSPLPSRTFHIGLSGKY